MTIYIEYELGGIKTKDTVYVTNVTQLINYLMTTKKGREKLLNKELTINIIKIEQARTNKE